MSLYHLAQVNIARMLAPLEDPIMAGFVEQLEPLNALAESSQGFVWRLKTDEGDATSLKAYDDLMIIVNMSVWESPDALRAYVYRSQHTAALRERKSWFAPYDGPYYALWWVEQGHLPTVDEAKAKLEHLRLHGETAESFSFRTLFPEPGTETQRAAAN